jgi:hypothetical protein
LNTDIINLLYEKITKSIIGATFNVYNELGYGFLEKVYQRALQVELIQRGHQAAAEHAIKVGLLINFGREKVEFKRFIY